MFEMQDSTFHKHFLPKLKKLLQLDTRLSTYTSVAFEAFKQQRMLPNLVEEGRRISDYITYSLVGSAAEGTAVARALGNGSMGIEVDLLVFLAKIDENHFQQIVEPIKENFYRVKNCPQIWKLIQQATKVTDNLSHTVSKRTTQDYFSGKDIKDFIQEILDFDFTSDAIVDAVSTLVSQRPLYRPNVELEANLEIHGPAVNIMLNVLDQHAKFKIMDIDVVVVLQGDFWPSMAKEWRSRQRHWPPQCVLEEAIEQGFQLVAKPRGFFRGSAKEDSADNIDQAQWCMSFTLAEKIINQARLPCQKTVYLIGKTIFYCHLKLSEGEHEFSSYILKTCMMWLQEETPVEEWVEDNVLSLVAELLKKLQEAVAKWELPYYFIPEINLLGPGVYPASLLEKAREKLSSITQNVVNFLVAPFIIDAVCELGKSVLNTAKTIIVDHFRAHPPNPPINLDVLDAEEDINVGTGDEAYEDYELD